MRRRGSSRRVITAPETPFDQAGHLLVVDELRTAFRTPLGRVRAVDGVSFSLERGRTLGVVGESGSGKTVLARTIMGLLPRRNVEVSGQVTYDGRDITGASAKVMRGVWGIEMAMVFQDPMTSLNPVMRIGRQIDESLRHHLDMAKDEAGQGINRREFLVGASTMVGSGLLASGWPGPAAHADPVGGHPPTRSGEADARAAAPWLSRPIRSAR